MHVKLNWGTEIKPVLSSKQFLNNLFQVVYHKIQDLYILFTRWGRVGDSGQYQHTPFQKKSEAITEFGKMFRSKTGNYWSNIKL